MLTLDTPDGTLVVEVDQPDATVRVVDAITGKIEVTRPATGEKLTIAVDPGRKRPASLTGSPATSRSCSPTVGQGSPSGGG